MAEELGTDTAGMTRLLDRLEAKQLIPAGPGLTGASVALARIYYVKGDGWYGAPIP
ncbi:hypothetical protein AB0395_08110 [Streptosporangium sp. NPDC051023]|uniref:hypothetical protein n=1 Tax=Streptosporangium sp. NPDC051023 TaxID=3155410 RepID=UPI00344C1863